MRVWMDGCVRTHFYRPLCANECGNLDGNASSTHKGKTVKFRRVANQTIELAAVQPEVCHGGCADFSRN